MKIGFDQIKNPSPKWFKRLNTALIVFVMPSFAAFVMGIPDKYLSGDAKNLLGTCATFAIGILKGLEKLSGEEETETPQQ